MKKNKFLIIVVLFFFTTILFAENVRLNLFIPEGSVVQGNDLKISLSVTGSKDVASVRVAYRSDKSGKFKLIILSEKGSGDYEGFIPAKNILPPTLEYYIYAMTNDNKRVYLFASSKKPFSVSVTKKTQETSDLEEEFALFAAEDVVLTASKHKQKASESPSAISVIDSKFIETSGIISMAELMRFTPGMEVYQLNPGYYNIGARGMADDSNNMSLFLLDGMEMNNQMFGIPFSEIVPITFDEISRIEVIRGPSSDLYGANAFSTVINILSEDPSKKPGYHIKVEGGNLDSYYTTVKVNNVKGDLSYSLSGGYQHSRAFDKDDAGFDNKLLRTTFKYHFFEGSDLKISAGTTQSFAEIYSAIGKAPTTASVFFINNKYTIESFTFTLYWIRTDADVVINDPTYNALLSNINGLNDVVNGEIQYNWDIFENNKLILGVNGRFSNFYSEVFIPKNNAEERAGFFFHDEYTPFEFLKITVGARYDWNSVTKPGFSPKLAFVLPFNKHTVRLSVARAFLKPSFYQSQMKVATLDAIGMNFSRSGLDNEEMTAYEMGYVGQFSDFLRVNLDLYYNQHRHAIQFSGTDLTFDNIGNDSDFLGVELSLRYAFTKVLTGFMNYSYLKSKNVTTNEEYKINPSHTVNAGLMATTEKFSAALFAQYISFRYVDLPNPIKGSILVPYQESQELGNYIDTWIKIGYNISKEVEIGINGKNFLYPGHKEFAGDDNIDYDGDGPMPSQTFGGSNIPTVVMLYLTGNF